MSGTMSPRRRFLLTQAGAAAGMAMLSSGSAMKTASAGALAGGGRNALPAMGVTVGRESDEENRPMLKIIVFVLAAIGGLAVLGIVGMVLMHAGMMGGLSC